MLIRQNLNKINILILLVLIQSFLYSSQDKKDNVLDNFIPNANLAKLISDYTVDWQLYKTIDAKGDIGAFAISPNGKYLVSGYGGGNVRIWSSENGKLLSVIPFGYSFNSTFSFSQPDGKYLAVSSRNQFLTKIFDYESGKEIKTFKAKLAAYSNSGKYLAANTPFHEIGIFDTNHYNLVRNFGFEDGALIGLNFTPDSRYLIYHISFPGSSIVIADIDDTSIKKYIPAGNYEQMDISKDGKFLAVGKEDGQAQIWDIETTKLIHTFLGNAESPFIKFSPSGKFFAAASESNLKIWDFKTKNLLKEIIEKDGEIKFVNFLPNNFLVYVLDGASGVKIKIWQFEGVE